MLIFYFDITDRKGLHRDEFGDRFETLQEAIVQVRALLPALAKDEPPDDDWHGTSCDLRDDVGTLVYHSELNYRGAQVPG